MKRIFDFAFCDGIITPDVVFYSVAVGSSKRDQVALASVRRIVKNDVRFLFVLHDVQMAGFIQQVSNSLFSGSALSAMRAGSLLRRAWVSVVQLARFLKSTPPQLLNSRRVDTKCDLPLWLGCDVMRSASGARWRPVAAGRKVLPAHHV